MTQTTAKYIILYKCRVLRFELNMRFFFQVYCRYNDNYSNSNITII